MTIAVDEAIDGIPGGPIAPVRRWRFVLVLLTAILVSTGQTFISDLVDGRMPFDFSVALLIMAALLLTREPGTHQRTARALGVAAFVSWCAAWLASDAYSAALLIVFQVLTACLFALTLGDIVRTILAGHATGDAILAAVCGYLLLGIIWTLLYESIETAAPGSFSMELTVGDDDAVSAVDRSDLGYFSFVTLSTVGYGDVLPATRLTRTLAWIEAVTGQFYLAVLVAGLVGYRVSQGRVSQGRVAQGPRQPRIVSSRSPGERPGQGAP